MRSPSFFLPAVAVVAIAAGVGWMLGTWWNDSAGPTTSFAARKDRGQVVYQVYCAGCHGPEGHGDGPSASALRPPPRDFAARPWRFEPTREAIHRATIEGIPGTAMPSFASLPASDLEAVVAHIRRLAAAPPVGDRPTTREEKLLAAAGFTSLLGTVPPPLKLLNPAGQPVRLKDHFGRLILLHFWGTGCTHCVKEIPALTALERRHAGRLVVLHICTDEDDAGGAQKTLDRTAPGTAALTEADGLGLARFEVQTLPTVWLIAPDGTAIGRSSGVKDWTATALLQVIEHWLPPAR